MRDSGITSQHIYPSPLLSTYLLLSRFPPVTSTFFSMPYYLFLNKWLRLILLICFFTKGRSLCGGQWEGGLVPLPLRRGSGLAAEPSYHSGDTLISFHTKSHDFTLHYILFHPTRIHTYTYPCTYTHTYILSQIADLCQPPGVGDKKILRTLAFNLGLERTSSVVKRAIQFGTRVAKHTNVMYHGSNRKGKGDTRI